MSLRMVPERRTGERWPTQHAIKVYDPRSARYVAGFMRNTSASGALLELKGSIAAQLGECIYLAILARHGDVVARGRMTPAVVRRFIGGNGSDSRFVAVEFATASDLAEAA